MNNFKQWFLVCKQDLLHSASGTNYSLGKVLPLKSFLVALLMSEFQIVIWYRIYSAFYKKVSKTIGGLLYLAIKFIYKCDLHPSANIGAGLLLVHGFDIVIGPDVVIGKNVVIFNGVSLGKKYVGVLNGPMPTIGDACIIGTGAKLLGGINVGENVVVGANSLVITDVPPNTTCAGNPARIINN